MPRAYYNENNPHCAAWLRALIAEDIILQGDVDERSIVDVLPGDLDGYNQCHFFAGIGGWPYAARLAGWPDDLPLWTGSCPCQPFSTAGQRKGTSDVRHLWPDLYRLLRAKRPARLVGEQVAKAPGLAWFDGVRSDLERSAYAYRPIVIPALAVNAPTERERLWFVAVAERAGERQRTSHDANSPLPREGSRSSAGRPRAGDGPARGLEERVARGHSKRQPSDERLQLRPGRPHKAAPENPGDRPRNLGRALGAGLALGQGPGEDPGEGHRDPPAQRASRHFWANVEWLPCADGKIRRLEPGIALLADGLPRDVAPALSGFGNAIVPQLAAEILAALLETLCE